MFQESYSCHMAWRIDVCEQEEKKKDVLIDT